ncbi:MAG TPA: AI-2E family transporter [Streptosporangiaceae bacterium]|nr:AI-2E family transporter [Streptosporangiaceae bacterium]
MGGVPQKGTRLTRLWTAAESRNVPLRAILTTVAVVVATYLLGKIVYRLRDVLLLIVVSGFIALVLNPLVYAVQRRVVSRRGLAVTVVIAWAALVFAGLAAAFGYPLVNGISHFAQQLPRYVASAEHGTGWIGHLVRRYHIQEWVQHITPKLVTYGESLGKPALTVGKGALTLVAGLAVVLVLVVLLLLEGPRVRTWLLAQVPDDRAARYTRLAGQVNRSVAGYILGDLVTSVIAGVVVFAALLATGVPFALLWALWVALVDFLAMIGGALAGIPTVLFAAAHSLTAGIVTLVVFLAYTVIENHVLNPIVMSKTVRVSPLLVLIAVLVGAGLGDWIAGLFGAFVAALIAIPAAGAIQIVARDIWQATATPDLGRRGRYSGMLPMMACRVERSSPPEVRYRLRPLNSAPLGSVPVQATATTSPSATSASIT